MTLDKENLPSEITQRLEWVQNFVEEFKIDEDSLEGMHHVFLFRVNIGQISEKDADQYMQAVTAANESELAKVGCMGFYIPTRDEPTSLTIVDLRTMKYAKL